MNLIATEWLSYMDKVIPKGASNIQILECKRAFYAGAYSFYVNALELAEAYSEKIAEEKIANMAKELSEFKDNQYE
jgi:hypothetical protein